MTDRLLLLALERDPGAWRELLERHEGQLPLAAYELAHARLVAHGLTGPPSRAELYSAAQEVQARAGRLAPLPTKLVIAADCRSAGLTVLD